MIRNGIQPLVDTPLGGSCRLLAEEHKKTDWNYFQPVFRANGEAYFFAAFFLASARTVASNIIGVPIMMEA